MKVGCCYLTFYLHGNDSLKGKRQIVRSIKDRLRGKFNVSVAEVGEQDVWQSLHVGIAAVSADHAYLDGLLSQIIESVDRMHLAEMTGCEKKIIQVGAGMDEY